MLEPALRTVGTRPAGWMSRQVPASLLPFLGFTQQVGSLLAQPRKVRLHDVRHERMADVCVWNHLTSTDVLGLASSEISTTSVGETMYP